MFYKLNWRSGIISALLCTMALIAVCLATVSGQSVPGQIPGQVIGQAGTSGTSQDSAYCVGLGYNYAVIPGVNGNQPVCQFPDNTWCDAHAFATGTCTLAPLSYYSPYYFNTTQSALDIASQTAQCRRMGGSTRTVHTAYGDVDLCVFSDGSSVDLRSLNTNAGLIGYPGADFSPVSPLYGGDSWYYYAYSWLNAP